MNCEKVERRLASFLDQDLDEAEKTMVQAHLTQCTVCSRKVKEFGRLREVVLEHRILPEEAEFGEMRRHLFKRIRESRPSKEMVLQVLPTRRWAPIVVPITAALLLLTIWIVPGRYEAFTLREGVLELAMVEEMEEGEPLMGEVAGEAAYLEEELAMVDELLVLAQADSDEDLWLQEELELLNALGEGEEIDEAEEPEELEEELAQIEEESLG